MKKSVKVIIEYFLKILILLQGILKLIINLKRIIKAKYIILHTAGGFGHSIQIPDLIRSKNRRDDYLYIMFFEFGRYNYYSKYLFNINQINIYSAFSIGKIRFGEYERINDVNYGIKFLKYILYRIIKKETRILSSDDFWNHLVSENKEKIDSFIKKFITRKEIIFKNKSIITYLRRTVLSYLLCKDNSKFKLPKKLIKKIQKKIPDYLNYKNKFLTVYIRNREGKKNIHSYLRNSNWVNYIDTIKYFINLGWKINLIGDYDDKLIKGLNNHESLVYASKFSINKKLFEIFSMIYSKFIISTEGGAQTLGFYSHMINVNQFPIGFIPSSFKTKEILLNKNDYILYKELRFNEKKVDEKNIDKFLFKFVLPRGYSVIENNSEEIMYFCKKHYNKHLKRLK